MILATGSKSTLPDVMGLSSDHVVALRTLADAERLKRFPGPVSVIGDGWMAVETAWHLALEGREVSLIGKNDQLIKSVLDKEAGVFLLRLAEDVGVRIALSGELLRIDPDQVLLKDGRVFDAALTVIAAGSRCETRLATQLALDCGRGIRVNEQMQTSDPRIFAAGDCVEYNGKVSGRWQEAVRQGKVAGCNAAGGAQHYLPEEMPYVMNAMGVQVFALGTIGEDSIRQRRLNPPAYAKLFFQEEQLCGAQTIGLPAAVIKLEKALAERLPKQKATALLHEIMGKQG